MSGGASWVREDRCYVSQSRLKRPTPGLSIWTGAAFASGTLRSSSDSSKASSNPSRSRMAGTSLRAARRRRA
jgi:hypothetical protein